MNLRTILILTALTATLPAAADSPANSPQDPQAGNIPQQDYEYIYIDVPDDTMAELNSTIDIPPALIEMIETLFQCQSIKTTVPVLRKYKERRAISSFGASKDCSDPADCFWVVENNGGITVLGPEKGGLRANFLTGTLDIVELYDNGLWFKRK